MKVSVARSAGFCFGVRRAIEIALHAADAGERVFMFGDLVHNELVISELRRRGIRKINRLVEGRGSSILIRAHGASALLYDNIKEAGYGIIDATCPKVKQIHAIAREDERRGYRVIIIGDRDHDEVLGIRGNLSRDPLTIQPSGRFPARRLEGVTRASIVVQSTQDPERVGKLVEKIRSLVPEVVFHNTICAPTTQRQREARELALENDAVFIIGSAKSANTRRLHEISRKINRRSYWINDWTEIDRFDLDKVESVGVIAGASTPDKLIRDVSEYLKRLPPRSRQRKGGSGGAGKKVFSPGMKRRKKTKEGS